MKKQRFTLRHARSPVLVLPIICSILIIAWIPYMVRTHDFAPLWMIPLLAACSAVWWFLTLRYRIVLEGDTITMQAASWRSDPAVFTSMNIVDITSIHNESSIVRGRPFRRIVIASEQGERVKSIDVFLKHFRIEDIRKLLKDIHEKRPDLQVPQVYARRLRIQA